MRIAITGGIGTGKSYVCNRLKTRGIDVYDCDAAAKRLMVSNDDVRRQLTELIGADAYNAQGELNKDAVRRFLLADEANQQAINAVVHPAVAFDFKSSGLTWMECAILFESGFDHLVDTIVCISAPMEVRLKRIMARDGKTRTEAQRWIDAQMPQEERERLSDHVLINDGVADIDLQLDIFCRMIE